MIENRNAKKICIAIHGLFRAGAERVAASWCNYLAEHGHQVSVMIYAPTEDTFELDPRVRVIPLADSLDQFYGMSKLKQLSAIRRVIQQEKPQVLISFLPKMQISVMLATLGIRMKRMETVRNNPWIDTDVSGRRFLWNLCFHRSNVILLQTKEQSEYFPKRLQNKCVVISNPISGSFLDHRKVYHNNRISKFVAVARINAQKNYPMMIRAFARIVRKYPDCTLDIYGSSAPDQQQVVEKLILDLGMEKNVRLCGWRRDICDLVSRYDAFLMSSDYEGMPNALAEAMATGLVCLSTDCRTGPKDMIVSGTNGILAKTGDDESFAQGIQTILNMDQQQLATMGNLARETILEMCSEENTLARLKQLIETVV